MSNKNCNMLNLNNEFFNKSKQATFNAFQF